MSSTAWRVRHPARRRWRQPVAAESGRAEDSQTLLNGAEDTQQQPAAGDISSALAPVNSAAPVEGAATAQPSGAIQPSVSFDGPAASSQRRPEAVNGAADLNSVAAVLAEGSNMARELLGSILPAISPVPAGPIDAASDQVSDQGSRADAGPVTDSDAALNGGEQPSTSGRDADPETADGTLGARRPRRRSGPPAWPMATVLFDMGGGPQQRSMRKGIVRKPRPPLQQPVLDESLFSAATAKARSDAASASVSEQADGLADGQSQAQQSKGDADALTPQLPSFLSSTSGEVTDGSNPSVEAGQSSEPSLLDAASSAAARLLRLTNGLVTPQPEPKVG